VKLAVLALLGFVGGSVQSHSGRLPRTTDIPTFTAHEGLVFANGDRHVVARPTGGQGDQRPRYPLVSQFAAADRVAAALTRMSRSPRSGRFFRVRGQVIVVLDPAVTSCAP